MTTGEIIAQILGALGMLGFGATATHFFYKRKHPTEVEAGQLANVKDWQLVYPGMVEKIQVIADKEVEQLKKEFDQTLREAQEKERIECDKKIDDEIKEVKKEFGEKMRELRDEAKAARESSESNQNIIKSAMKECGSGCFAKVNQRA